MTNSMRYNELRSECKRCEWMKPWSLDIGGNHGCTCMKHNILFFNGESDECECYELNADVLMTDEDSEIVTGDISETKNTLNQLKSGDVIISHNDVVEYFRKAGGKDV